MGRPSKLTPAVHDWLVRAKRGGAPLRAAATAIAVDPDTVWRWRTAGREACEAAGLEGSVEMSDEDLAVAVGEDKVAVVKLYRALLAAEARTALVGASTRMRVIEGGNWRLARKFLIRTGADPTEVADYQPPPRVRRMTAGASSAGGRPSKLTDHMHRELVRLTGAGAYASEAAAAVGISASTFRRWMRLGEGLFEIGWELVVAMYTDDDHEGPSDIIPTAEELAEVLDPEEWRYVSLYRDVGRAQAIVWIQVTKAWEAACEHDPEAIFAALEWRFPDQWTIAGSVAAHKREQAERAEWEAERARKRAESGRAQAAPESPVYAPRESTLQAILDQLEEFRRQPGQPVGA